MLTKIDKALVAGIGAGGAAYAALAGTGQFSQTGLIIAAVSGLVVGLVTFLVPNKPA